VIVRFDMHINDCMQSELVAGTAGHLSQLHARRQASYNETMIFKTLGHQITVLHRAAP